MLATIRDSLGDAQQPAGSSARDIPLSPSEVLDRCERDRTRLIEQFSREFTKVRGHLHTAPDRDSIKECLLAIASEHSAKRVVSWRTGELEQMELCGVFQRAGIALVEDLDGSEGGGFVRDAANAEMGVSGADYALADTGTLVLLGGSGRARSASLLPPVHVAMLKKERVIHGLDDLFVLVGEPGNGSLPSTITFVTGPSRTADIELTLVVGVHGPHHVHVILVD
jgi:L-lactate dehydrogenase complex protein LldG